MGRIEGCVGVMRDCLPKLGDGVSRLSLSQSLTLSLTLAYSLSLSLPVPCVPQPVQQHGDPSNLSFETQVLIPQPFMGTIIGTAGSKIKELRSVSLFLSRLLASSLSLARMQKTKTSIKIFSDPMPNSNERSVQLIGTEQQITECIFYFLDEISKVCVSRVSLSSGNLLHKES